MATVAQPGLLAATAPRRSWLTVLPDAPALLFAFKTYAAAVVAFWISLSVGMEHPSWSLTTAVIVSQPLAGGVVGKAIYRMIGTALSAVVAILLVPNLVDSPELLALALALWLGFCSFVSGLNRSPSAYTFLMSGYTVAIISYPVLEAPQTVFTVAAFRVQEIGVGILAAAFFHGAILPQTITARLVTRAREIVARAERWTAEGLATVDTKPPSGERRRIAVDLDELRTLAGSLPYDTARLMPRVATIRGLRDQLMQLLPLTTTVEERRDALLHHSALPPAVATLLGNVGGWLSAPYDAAHDGIQADALAARAAALEPVPASVPAWSDLLLLGLLARLAELIAIHHNCRLLVAQLNSPDAIFRRSAVPLIERHRSLLRGGRWGSLHLDIAGGLRTAIGAVLTTLLACAFWIATAWDSGANAVLFAGVVTALFGSQDNPKAAIFTFLTGILIGSVTGLFFAFTILPWVTDYVMLVAVLAPAFLIGGVGVATPSASARSLGFLIGLINVGGLDLRYDADFASEINGTLALVLGVLFASLMIGLMGSVDRRAGVTRVIRAGWRDLALRANLPGHADVADWIGRMIDRIGLLTPRLEALDIDPGQPLFDALVVMRVGYAAGMLRNLRRDARADAAIVTPVLAGVARYYRTLDVRTPRPPPVALRDTVDRAIAGVGATAVSPARREGLLALASLRTNLFPGAPAPRIA